MEASESSDLVLIKAAVQGDRAAYGILVDRHLKSVYNVALRIVGNSSDAEDVAQDAFLRAFERLDLFDSRWSFRNWLLKIASNLAINRIRARDRERRLHLKLADPLVTDGEGAGAEAADSGGDGRGYGGAGGSASVDGSVDSEFAAERAGIPSPRQWTHWLDQLDEVQRTAIVLFHFQEMPYTEIAEVLQIPINTVRTHLYRGRKRLRELMGGQLDEDGSWEP